MEDELEGVELSYLRRKALSSIHSKRKRPVFQEGDQQESDFGIDALLVSPKRPYRSLMKHRVSEMSDHLAVEETLSAKSKSKVGQKRRRQSSASSNGSVYASSSRSRSATSSRSSHSSSRTRSHSSSNSSTCSSNSESHSSQSTSYSRSSFSSSPCSPSPRPIEKQAYVPKSRAPKKESSGRFQHVRSDRDFVDQRAQSFRASAEPKRHQGHRSEFYRNVPPKMRPSRRSPPLANDYCQDRLFRRKHGAPPDQRVGSSSSYQHRHMSGRNGSPSFHLRSLPRESKLPRSHQSRQHLRDVYDGRLYSRIRERPSSPSRAARHTSRVGSDESYSLTRVRGSRYSDLPLRDATRKPVDSDKSTTVRSSVKRIATGKLSPVLTDEADVSASSRLSAAVSETETAQLKQCKEPTFIDNEISPRSCVKSKLSADLPHKRSDLLSGGDHEEELDYDESMEEFDLFPMENLDESSTTKSGGDTRVVGSEGKIQSPIRVSPEHKELRLIQDTSSLLSHDDKLPVKERLYISKRTLEEKKRRVVGKEHSSRLRPSLASRLGPSPYQERRHHSNVSLYTRGGRGRPSKGDAFTIAEEYRRRKKMVRQEEIAKARKLTKMINESESTAANPTHLESLDSDAKEHALDKRINVIKEQNRAILKRTREVRHDKELHC